MLNKQREQIYSQRDRIFTKEDLTEDVDDMLQSEVGKRVELGLSDEEGPWKLIAWLEQVQPPFESQGRFIPTFGLSLILNELNKSDDVRAAIPDIVSRAIEIEQSHTLRAIEALIEHTEGDSR